MAAWQLQIYWHHYRNCAKSSAFLCLSLYYDNQTEQLPQMSQTRVIFIFNMHFKIKFYRWIYYFYNISTCYILIINEVLVFRWIMNDTFRRTFFMTEGDKGNSKLIILSNVRLLCVANTLYVDRTFQTLP